MDQFLAATKDYVTRIPTYLKNNEWVLDKAFQQTLLQDISAIDLCTLPAANISLNNEITAIDRSGQNLSAIRTTILELISHEEDVYVVLGVLLYMYAAVKQCWKRDDEPILLRLQVCMMMLGKPTALNVPISVIGVV